MTKENQNNPEEITRERLFHFLAAFIEENKLQVSHVAKAIGCSEASLNRIILKKTLPSDEMLKQSGIIFAVGFDKYVTLTDAENEQISEKIYAVGGVVGTVAAIVGSIGGGAMVAGIAVAAAFSYWLWD